jgi:HSP20 family protein
MLTKTQDVPAFASPDSFLNRVLEEFDRGLQRNRGYDMIRREDETELRLNMPGVPRENVEVTVSNGKLVVEGEANREDENFVRRRKRSFSYEWAVNPDVDPSSITAHLKNGVLHVVVPRPEQSTGTQIEVE